LQLYVDYILLYVDSYMLTYVNRHSVELRWLSGLNRRSFKDCRNLAFRARLWMVWAWIRIYFC